MGRIYRKRRIRHSAAPSASVITSEKKNITVLSLDYDGCGDLLFEEALEKSLFKNKCDPGHNHYLQGFRSAIQGARAAFEDLLSIETTGADVVELCVGSNRQTRKLDKLNGSCNKTGLCFEMYADLAEKKHWHFNKMLLADFIDDSGELRAKPLKPGTAMGILKKIYTECINMKRMLLQIHFKNMVKTSIKQGLLSQQIKAILGKYPNDKIKFVFIDDKMDIIQALHGHFNSDDQCFLRSNLENIELKLIHYNTAEFLTRYGRMNVENSTLIDAAKKRINYVATLPIQERALTFNSINKKSQESTASLGLFSKSDKLKKSRRIFFGYKLWIYMQSIGLNWGLSINFNYWRYFVR